MAITDPIQIRRGPEFIGSYTPSTVGSTPTIGGELNNFRTLSTDQLIKAQEAFLAEAETRISPESMRQQLSEALGTNLQD